LPTIFSFGQFEPDSDLETRLDRLESKLDYIIGKLGNGYHPESARELTTQEVIYRAPG